MGLPDNMEDLIISDYLALLTLAANKANKIIGYKCTKSGILKQSWSEEQKLFLHGLGSPLALGRIPERPAKLSGGFGRGLSCAVKVRFTTQANMDPRLLKIMETKYALTELLGDAWAKKEVIIKRLVDNVLTAIKTLEMPGEACMSWIKPNQELFKIYPVSTKNLLKSELLDDIERNSLIEDFKDILESKEFKIPEIKSPKILVDVIEELKKEQKRISKLKNHVDEIIATRLKAVYSFKGNSKMKSQRRPLKDLMLNMKKSKEYLEAFNPSKGMRLPSFMPLPFYPQTQEEEVQLKRRILTWVGTYGNSPLLNRAELCSSWAANATQS